MNAGSGLVWRRLGWVNGEILIALSVQHDRMRNYITRGIRVSGFGKNGENDLCLEEQYQ